jgi:predicted dienelactone hydrolase
LRDQIAVIGHSIGGYTSLAVAGGRPMTGPYEAEGSGRPVPTSPDQRIRALVLLAPACGWFGTPGSLVDVEVPILLFTAEKDALGSHLHADLVDRGVPDPSRVKRCVISNAGHYAFQSPFPLSMTRPDFPPSQDPPGFDRAAFQPVLHAEILSFLRSVLR